MELPTEEGESPVQLNRVSKQGLHFASCIFAFLEPLADTSCELLPAKLSLKSTQIGNKFSVHPLSHTVAVQGSKQNKGEEGMDVNNTTMPQEFN